MSKAPVEALRRGLVMLEHLAGAGGAALSPTDLAERQALKITTAYNLLKTLELCGFAQRSRRGQYVLGWKYRSLTRPLRFDLNPHGPVAEAIRQVAQQTGESVVLATLVAGRRQVLARATGTQVVAVDSATAAGEGESIWGQVTGRTLAAWCGADEFEIVIAQADLPGSYWPGIATRKQLDNRLARIRRNGFATDRGPDVTALAVPILNDDDELLGALGLYLPSYRYAGKSRDIYLKTLHAQSLSIASVLSDRPGQALEL